jgi:hypothetical protein
MFLELETHEWRRTADVLDQRVGQTHGDNSFVKLHSRRNGKQWTIFLEAFLETYRVVAQPVPAPVEI